MKNISATFLIASSLWFPQTTAKDQCQPIQDPASRLVAMNPIGSLTITSYRSVRNQCDDSPLYTSIGERVHVGGVALSRDLLTRWGGPIRYGDTILIEGLGFYRVNDTMHSRIKKHVDVWVETYSDEKRFQQRWKSGKVNVWVMRLKR